MARPERRRALRGIGKGCDVIGFRTDACDDDAIIRLMLAIDRVLAVGVTPMEPFTKALETIAQVMRDGAATHPENDWLRWPVDYHLARAEQHLRLLRDGDQREVRSPDKARGIVPPQETRSVRQARPADDRDEIRRNLGLDPQIPPSELCRAMTKLCVRSAIERGNDHILANLMPATSWRGPAPD
jgi:hypothetical protein